MGMLLRAVVLLLLVLTAISAIRRILGMLVPSGRDSESLNSSGNMVKDPVCGTYVSPQTAFSARNEFFCSEECRTKFLTPR